MKSARRKHNPKKKTSNNKKKNVAGYLCTESLSLDTRDAVKKNSAIVQRVDAVADRLCSISSGVSLGARPLTECRRIQHSMRCDR